ncbi:hypothetical protein GCM10010182_10470 [Actinomadura cremea]|nr:hypothetical protein GCM10010182_10470 [Actinomadura cremea]
MAAGTMLAATAIIMTTSTAATGAPAAGAPATGPEGALEGPPVPADGPVLPMGRPPTPVFPPSVAASPPVSLQAPGKDDAAAKDEPAGRPAETAGTAGAMAHQAPTAPKPAAEPERVERPRAPSKDAEPVAVEAGGPAEPDLPRLSKSMRLEHEFVTNVLRSRDIDWRSTGNCSDREKPTCTSFSGLRWTTLEGLLRFAETSGCKIVVTGGTERGHASGLHSHYNGYKIDIAPNRCVDREIEGYDREGVRGDGARLYRSPEGGLYARESDHWDITYT